MISFLDEFDQGFGWAPEEPLHRTGHAVLAGGGVWIIDPVDGDGIDERIRALGEPRGVVQLLDRHERDCAAVADRLGVQLHVLPFGGVPDAPFEVRRILNMPRWREVALWFPHERILVTADVLGSLAYFRARGERFGVNPLLRLFPPKRALSGLAPRRLLFGHGPGYHEEDAEAALRETLRKSRRRLPSALRSAFRFSSA